MISKKMIPLVNNNSAIRAMFEEGKKMAEKYGKDNVYDFSLGNPNVPAPAAVNKAIKDIIDSEDPVFVHGYMSNAGYEDVRDTIAASLNKKYKTSFDRSNLIMTVGAAAALNVILKTILDADDEVITFAPYFVEYGNYVRNYDGKLVVVPADTKSFEPSIDGLRAAINEKTKAIIINTPNNPTGVVYSLEILNAMQKVIKEAEDRYNTSILLISDEPYRELAYDGVSVPWITDIFPHSVVVYSYSKSLSLPGERIGWLLIPNTVPEFDSLVSAATIANRCSGCVNAPSLMQRVIASCVDEKTDIDYYDRNRELLYNSLVEYGYSCIKPQGAFYLFVKAPNGDEAGFIAACKKHNILVVPGSSFACEGYVRIAYCVSYKTIQYSLQHFKAVAEEFGLI